MLLMCGNCIQNLQEVLYKGWINTFGSIIWEARKNYFIIISTPKVIKPNKSDECYRKKLLCSKKRSSPYLEQPTMKWIVRNVFKEPPQSLIYI